ncbi:hypothetical protein DX933_09315 [Ornithinibacillus gellani]|uniref:hypothetical protein n=1 Tax=Ornithinibacillus gellani TaxID=2293253 RepID=UPI000F484E19|nr:hypothetical protein [Ornithinibacillus gellani]TQS74953.1 hypothetical protein DX933_09315 [Ornithinibacillus gellani]
MDAILGIIIVLLLIYFILPSPYGILALLLIAASAIGGWMLYRKRKQTQSESIHEEKEKARPDQPNKQTEPVHEQIKQHES